MSSEAPFEAVVADWTTTTLGELCDDGGGDLQTGPFGSQLHADDYVDQGIPSIMPQDLSDGRVDESEIARISEGDAERLSRYRVRTGDIVYSRRGDISRRAFISAAEDGWLCGTGCLRVRVGDAADPSFVFRYLGDPSVHNWLERHAVGATMPNLNTKILASLPVVLPPSREQHRIASVLDALDDKIEINRRIAKTLEEIAATLFKARFVDFVDHDDLVESEIGPIPRGWGVGALGAISEVLTRGRAPKYVDTDGVLVLNQKCVRNGRVSFEPGRRHDEGARSSADRRVRLGDVLVNSTGVGTLGRVAQVRWLPEPATIDSHVTMIRADGDSVDQSYLAMALLMRQADLERLGHGSTGQSELTQSRLREFTIPVPPIDEQEEFSQLYLHTREAIGTMEREGITLAVTRDTLLPKLISGQIRVPADAFEDTEAA